MATRLMLRSIQTQKTQQYSFITDQTVILSDFNDFACVCVCVNVDPDLASRIHNTGKHYYDYIKAAHNKSISLWNRL